jgi:purine-nucleoside/S-methyl-5'-thioadenosine phosphorylase / adenosine deaminase
MLQASNLAALERFRHGFFTRAGGVSRGIFEALNCGWSSGDHADRVEHNRALAVARLGAPAGSLCTVRQVHGTDVVLASAPEPGRPSRRADALVSDRPGITLGVLSADCAPVLFADHEARIVAAAHAGWRGALTGVIEATVAAMQTLGARPERIRAAVGPAIGPQAYEVGRDFERRFLDDDVANAAFFLAGKDDAHVQFDLPRYCGQRLENAGVVHSEILRLCTYQSESHFFSFRRSVHREEFDYGRQISAIVVL